MNIIIYEKTDNIKIKKAPGCAGAKFNDGSCRDYFRPSLARSASTTAAGTGT
jgi:hypothetical protein